MARIDDRTLVPLGIVVTLFFVGVGSAATGAFYMARIDGRLTRIEEKIGLPPYGEAKLNIIENANAGAEK